jgi:hypothetical protein
MSSDKVGDGQPKGEAAPKHPKVMEKHPKVLDKPTGSHPKVMGPKGGAAPSPKAASGDPAAEPPRRWIEGPARYALMVVLGLMVVVNLTLTVLKVTKRPTVVDTTVHLRTAGAAIPLYLAVGGPERVHVLKPGTAVRVEDLLVSSGPRLEVQVTLEDGITALGFVDPQDFGPGEIARMREVLQKAAGR